ncbi:MAG: putative signal transducing protein [Terriglobales bacterium]
MADRPKTDAVPAGPTPTGKSGRPNPHEQLVRVFDTEQESEALIVNGLLQSAGIQSDLTSLDAPQDILPGVGGTVILVRKEDAERARQLIQESKRAAAEDDTAEIDVTGDPTPLG